MRLPLSSRLVQTCLTPDEFNLCSPAMASTQKNKRLTSQAEAPNFQLCSWHWVGFVMTHAAPLSASCEKCCTSYLSTRDDCSMILMKFHSCSHAFMKC
jgi:hypothetical protein